ncbi:DnaB-like helicase N-terminal domain-containing protein, partial [Clostridium botulinum]
MNNKKLIKLYYDSRTGFQVIGCLLKKPILLRDKKYDLSPDDFYNNFHQYVFSAINNLYENGVEEINFVEIEAYLHQSSPKGYKIVFEDNEGMEWLTN